MNHFVAVALVAILFVSAVTAATDGQTPSLSEAAKKLLKNGIANESDLKAFLLAAPTWKWIRNGVPDTSVTFETSGVATHTWWVGKWTTTSSRKVVIRVPKIGPHLLTFSDDLMSFKGVWNGNVPFADRLSPVIPNSSRTKQSEHVDIADLSLRISKHFVCVLPTYSDRFDFLTFLQTQFKGRGLMVSASGQLFLRRLGNNVFTL